MKKFLVVLAVFCLSVSGLSAAQVQLQHANDVSFVLAHARVIHQVYGEIEVENLAFEKKVTVVYSVDGGNWQSTQATYVRSIAGNKDVFIFAIPMPESDYNGGNYDSRTVRFAIQYEVAGQTFWDNNGGQDYFVGTMGNNMQASRIILSAANVRLMGARSRFVRGWPGAWYFDGQIAIKNLGYHKQVNVVYTYDNWVTTRVASAYHQSTMANGVEVWAWNTSNAYHQDHTYKFAVSCEVNGQTWWDNNNNNGGNNYLLNFGSWIGMDIW